MSALRTEACLCGSQQHIMGDGLAALSPEACGTTKQSAGAPCAQIGFIELSSGPGSTEHHRAHDSGRRRSTSTTGFHLRLRAQNDPKGLFGRGT